jgi:3'-phosphoadenosine 5'-phosphosulfate sulfotransferase (PAPS reductase)/FAD synthetase
MKNILCWSAGKDSTATGILAKLNNVKIDEIITVMPDPFQKELELLEKFEDFMGQKVTMIECPTFEDYFFRKKVRGAYKGTIYGWPFTAYKTCARILKWEPMQRYVKGRDCRFLLGIAKGEARNILEPNKSLLIEYGYTEEDARNLCIEYGLLNPLYDHFKRLGCVRCPKQGYEALMKVKTLEPDKFNWMMEKDSLSPVKFKPNKTLNQFLNGFEKTKAGGQKNI